MRRALITQCCDKQSKDGSNWPEGRQHTYYILSLSHTHMYMYTPGSSLLSLWPCSWSPCSATVACSPSPPPPSLVASFSSLASPLSAVAEVVSRGSGVKPFSLVGNPWSPLLLSAAFFGGSELADFFDLPSSPNSVKNHHSDVC